MVKALRLVGREITREKLIQALESLKHFRTDFGPRISYGPGRRVGSGGAYVVSSTGLAADGWPTPHWVEVPY